MPAFVVVFFWKSLLMRILCWFDMELKSSCFSYAMIYRYLKLLSCDQEQMASLLITYLNAFQLGLLRENGDDQPLVLRTKQILKETLMIGLSSIR